MVFLPKNGLGSLKIVESSSQRVEKPRKLSKEEDRLAECQLELQAVADAESKFMNAVGNTKNGETIENDESVESETESVESENDESETEIWLKVLKK